MEREILSTKRKALRINLNPSIFGSFAEIGGGQEVARSFFQAGGASGTIAKTISAYDKVYSDDYYDTSDNKRYVSEERLIQMLKIEYEDLTRLLCDKKDGDIRFFAFANTVETLNFNKDNRGHGWIGVRFQLTPGGDSNEVVIHVNLLENDNLLQQNTLGVLGVNLLFACYYYYNYPNQFIQSLLDNLSTDRIEINMIRMRGAELNYVDNRLLSVQLVKNGMTPAIMFDRYGNVQQPSDMLYKKNVLAFRGSFRPITYVGFDMLKTSYQIFKRDEDYNKHNTYALCEITLNNLLEEGELDERDFLDRVDLLNGMGQNVMISNIRFYYKLVQYFSQFKIKKLRIILGVLTFEDVLNEKYYTNLKGGILEAFGKTFLNNMKFYIYPALDTSSQKLITSRTLNYPPHIKILYEYLLETRKIIDIEDVNFKKLHIFSRHVLKMIQEGDEGWEEMVPKYISDNIKKKKIFGFK